MGYFSFCEPLTPTTNMAKLSAGLLVYRLKDKNIEVFLVHPGGPFWAKKNNGAWSIPKGEYSADEDPLEAAKREFKEETGFAPPAGKFTPLQPAKQPSGKVISAWVVKGDFDAEKIKSNSFSMEWPPKSGKQQEFLEVDRAEWFSLDEAKMKILKGQKGFLEQLAKLLRVSTKS